MVYRKDGFLTPYESLFSAIVAQALKDKDTKFLFKPGILEYACDIFGVNIDCDLIRDKAKKILKYSSLTP